MNKQTIKSKIANLAKEYILKRERRSKLSLKLKPKLYTKILLI